MSAAVRVLFVAAGLALSSASGAAPDQSARVFELVRTGQLDAAHGATDAIDSAAHGDALRRLIEQRAAAARRLLDHAKKATAQGDLTAAQRAIESALAIDARLATDALVDDHKRREAQVAAEIARASACAAQRKFGCVMAAVEAARRHDRYNPAATFWSFYANDWRPAR